MSVKITIIGTGYVGLVSGACFAELGHDVICVDKDKRKIDMLNEGEVPIYEPGLEALLEKCMAAGRLRFSLDLAESVKDRDAVFISVGTPPLPGMDRADLKYVWAATEELASAVDGFTVIIMKSTIPVGTNNQVLKIAQQHIRSGSQIAIASNPEFLREGAAISDFMEPDRIVVGCDDERAETIIRSIYEPLIALDTPLLLTGIQTAELIKYAANAFLAVKISFINEMANLCEAVDADVEEVAAGIGLDKRISPTFLNTGPGWGGSCFPKDTRALLATASEFDVSSQIVKAAVDVNNQRKVDMIQKVIEACDGTVAGKRVAVWGLTFKGQTDDMRESTSLVILPELVKQGAHVIAYDPSSPDALDELLPQVEVASDPVSACEQADILVVLTDWREFKSYNLEDAAMRMKNKTLLDLRNLYHDETARAAGMTRYIGLGKKSAAN